MSLGGGITENEDTIIIVNTPIREPVEGTYTGPLFQTRFLEGVGRGIYGGAVDEGEILCMSLVDERNPASNTHERRPG